MRGESGVGRGVGVGGEEEGETVIKAINTLSLGNNSMEF